MYILGLNCYAHDSAAALIKDGVLRVLIEEERLSREKHSSRYPKNAIAKCLEMEGITIEQVDHITFFYKPLLELTGNLSHVLKYFPQSLNLLRSASGSEDRGALSRLYALQNVGSEIQKQFGLKKAPKVNFIEHHLCHAASCFFASDFEEAAILTLDGRGESTCTMMAVGRKNKIKKLKEIRVPHSLGHLYSALTDHLGFKAFVDEWKVMGMSAYGKDTYLGDFKKLVRLHDQGYVLDLDYFNYHLYGRRQWLSPKFFSVFGQPRAPGAVLEQRHFDLAFALQKTVEDAAVSLASHLYELTKLPALCLAGGVALNVLMNKEIMAKTGFQKFFIQPIANDAGTSFGSALYLYNQQLRRPRAEPFRSPYLGPEFSNEEIESALKANGVAFKRCEDIAKTAAKAIAENKIVGWFQGRMEAGPRALGNRSIIANPTDPSMKDRLNARVKRRENFRPFAPSVLEEKTALYFDLPKDQRSPYMILAGDVRPEMRSRLPATTHVDFTARVHTVDKSVNPRYWSLIAEFEKLSGVAIVLNTSFNENEPIVCTPQEAIACFLRTDFDALAIGDYYIERQPLSDLMRGGVDRSCM